MALTYVRGDLLPFDIIRNSQPQQNVGATLCTKSDWSEYSWDCQQHQAGCLIIDMELVPSVSRSSGLEHGGDA